jgi:hypothetical protein
MTESYTHKIAIGPQALLELFSREKESKDVSNPEAEITKEEMKKRLELLKNREKFLYKIIENHISKISLERKLKELINSQHEILISTNSIIKIFNIIFFDSISIKIFPNLEKRIEDSLFHYPKFDQIISLFQDKQEFIKFIILINKCFKIQNEIDKLSLKLKQKRS